MGPEGIILVNPPITTLQQSLTHSAVYLFPGKMVSFHKSVLINFEFLQLLRALTLYFPR